MYYNDDHNHLSRLANRQREEWENELKTNKKGEWKEKSFVSDTNLSFSSRSWDGD